MSSQVTAWIVGPTAPVDLSCCIPDERAAAASLATGAQRRRHLRSRAVLRHAVARHRHVRAADVPLVAPPGTRPHLGDGSGTTLALAHAGGVVAVVLGEDGPVGIDVEVPAARRRPVPATVATAVRLDAVRDALPPGLAPVGTWVVLEAALKALGTGFTHPHAAATFRRVTDGVQVDLGDGTTFGVALRALAGPVVVAVAGVGAVPTVRWREVHIAPRPASVT